MLLISIISTEISLPQHYLSKSRLYCNLIFSGELIFAADASLAKRNWCLVAKGNFRFLEADD